MIDVKYIQNALEEVIKATTPSITSDSKKELIDQLDATLGKRIDLEVLNRLTKDDLEIYEEALASDGSDVAFQFALEIIDDSDTFLKSIVDRFCQEHIDSFNKLENK